jgi:DNA repair protein RadD
VTATPQRLDGKGLGTAFDVIVEGPQVRDLIGAGHLSRFDYLAPPSRADLSGVSTRMGDFDRAEAARIMDQAVITGDAVEHYARHLNGRPAIAFCISVEHAEHVAEMFRSRGWRAASVDGSMEPERRRGLIADLGRGRLNVLTSCELISEGVDVPVVAGALLLRPTKSLSMFLQQIGRCLRLKPDGSAAVILDHVGNVERHGLPDAPRAWSLAGRDKREGAPPNRTCGLCFKVVPIGCTPECDMGSDCGLAAEGAGGRPELQQVDGELVRYSDPHAWTGGIDMRTARGRDWFTLLERCDGHAERFEQIAKARGYKRGWVKHAMSERKAGRTGGSDFQAREWAA